ncbi:hypothetical protein MMC19_007709 [Ptychographa xylographoides]|nr:hypothetical protein [Ptychographa xylographoides]
MRSSATLFTILLITVSSLASAVSWGFDDATVSVQTKGAGVGGGYKEKISEKQRLPQAIQLGASDTLKIILTTQEGKSSKRPHQVFLNFRDATTDLETSFPFSVKESGKGKLELTQKDIPSQLLAAKNGLTASLVIASFGYSKPYNSPVFDLNIKRDAGAPIPEVEKPLRYGKLPEIHHVFKSDPTSPPKIVSLVFTAIVLAALPVLFLAWLSLGANINHLSKALSSSPISHGLFFGSIVAMEGVFFMYYTTWNLFQTLPAAGAIGIVTFLSGSRALTEVQERRLAGLR